MQSVTLRFRRRIKNVVLVDASKPVLIANDSDSTAKWGEVDKLTATESEQDAKSLLELKQTAVDWCARLGQQMNALGADRASTIRQFEDLAVQLAMKIASAVVRYEVNHHETRLRKLVEDFIERFEPDSPVVVYVHSLDLEILRSQLEEGWSETGIQLKLDDSLARGDMRLESSEQRMVADVRQQLADIESQIMECLHHARFEPPPI